jgi:hypothetical protein
MSYTLDWVTIGKFFNSNFMTSLIGALAGAAAGAFAAQRIVERGKHRDEVLKEIRNTNAAIALAFTITNTFLAMKNQHIKALKEKYDAQQAELEEFKRKRKAGEIAPNEVFCFQADFETLAPQAVPVDTLRDIVFERLTITGRPLSLVTVIMQTVKNLEESLIKRNSLIQQYRGLEMTPERLAPLYFGFPYEHGHVDLSHPMVIDAIYTQTDDGIFFSQLLCKDLYDHGHKLSLEFKKNHKDELPTVNEVLFDTEKTQSLMPLYSNYSDWLSAFLKKEK